jgi:hypothetical protein
MQIRTEIIIHANASSVWKELTNFEAYPEWNPFVTRIEGEVKVGNRIKAWLPGMVFTPKVIDFKKERAFSWLGQLFFKGLFDGHHQFYLEPMPDGTTKFIHLEDFKGILLPLFKNMLKTKTRPGFIEMNEALKNRVESKVLVD